MLNTNNYKQFFFSMALVYQLEQNKKKDFFSTKT